MEQNNMRRPMNSKFAYINGAVAGYFLTNVFTFGVEDTIKDKAAHFLLLPASFIMLKPCFQEKPIQTTIGIIGGVSMNLTAAMMLKQSVFQTEQMADNYQENFPPANLGL